MKYPNLYDVYAVDSIINSVAANINGKWVPARSLGFYSVWERFRLAWMVFTGKADALVWPEGQ